MSKIEEESLRKPEVKAGEPKRKGAFTYKPKEINFNLPKQGEPGSSVTIPVPIHDSYTDLDDQDLDEKPSKTSPVVQKQSLYQQALQLQINRKKKELNGKQSPRPLINGLSEISFHQGLNRISDATTDNKLVQDHSIQMLIQDLDRGERLKEEKESSIRETTMTAMTAEQEILITEPHKDSFEVRDSQE